VVVGHHPARQIIGHLCHASHHALSAELEQDPGQAERFIARSGGRLPQLASRQHDVWRYSLVGDLIGEQRPVNQFQRGEQRILPYMRTVGGDVHDGVRDQGCSQSIPRGQVVSM